MHHHITVSVLPIRGVDVDRDEKKVHLYELAAMGGVIEAMHNLGVYEWSAGNMERALKHFMIAAGC